MSFLSQFFPVSSLNKGVATVLGSTASFNGTNQYLTVSDNAALDIPYFTVGGWFWIDQSIGGFARILIEKWNTGSNQRTFTLQYDNNSDEIFYATSNNGIGSVSLSHSVTLNQQWAHIVASYDGSDMKLYLNGSEVASSGSQSGTLFNGSADLTIGGRSGGSIPMQGSMQGIMVFNRSLTGTEVTEWYSGGNAIQPFHLSDYAKSSLVIGIPLNSAVSSGREFEDFSGNELNPVLAGSVGIGSENIEILENKVYNAFLFDGIDDRITFSSDSSLDVTNEAAMSIWFKMPSSITDNFIYLFANSSGGANGYIQCFWLKSSNQIRAVWGLTGGTIFVDSSALNLDEWYHLVVDYDGSDGRIYINGVEDGIVAGGTNFNPQHTLWEIGDNTVNANGEFEGNLTQPIWINRSLAQREVRTLYNNNLVLEYSSIPDSIKDDIGFYLEMSSNDNSLTDLKGNISGITADGSVTSNGAEIDWQEEASFSYTNMTEFDGSVDLLDCGNDSSLDVSHLTISAWSNLDISPNTNNHIISKFNGAGNRSFSMWRRSSDNAVRFDLSFDGTNTVISLTSSPLARGRAYSHIVTFDGTTANLYTDGVLDDTSSSTGSIFISTANLFIGHGPELPAEKFKGSLGQVIILNRLATSLEREELYNRGRINQIQNLSSGLRADTVLHVPLNSSIASGREFEDFSGLENDGSASGSPEVSGSLNPTDPGLVYKSFSFNGVSTHITSALTNTADFSVSFWFRATSSSRGAMIWNYTNGPPNGGINIEQSTGNKLRFATQNGVTLYDINSINNINDSKWHHAVCTYNSTSNEMEMILDGVSQGTQTNPDGIKITSDFTIGRRSAGINDRYFLGSISQIRYFNRELNTLEAEELYNQNVPLDYASVSTAITDDCLLAYAMNSNDNTLNDLSGTGNDGNAGGGVTSDGSEIDWEV